MYWKDPSKTRSNRCIVLVNTSGTRLFTDWFDNCIYIIIDLRIDDVIHPLHKALSDMTSQLMYWFNPEWQEYSDRQIERLSASCCHRVAAVHSISPTNHNYPNLLPKWHPFCARCKKTIRLSLAPRGAPPKWRPTRTHVALTPLAHGPNYPWHGRDEGLWCAFGSANLELNVHYDVSWFASIQFWCHPD